MEEKIRELLEAIADEDTDIEVHEYPPEEEVSAADIIFEAGIFEAVKRLLRKHDDYGLIKFIRTICDVELEKEE